jgi:hypothetical protein
VLQELLKRFAPFGDTSLQLSSQWLGHQRYRFTLRVGGGSEEAQQQPPVAVSVTAGNKHEGKQRAAQELLKKCTHFFPLCLIPNDFVGF